MTVVNNMDRQLVIDTLHSENCSCVLASGNSLRIFRRRGIIDLLDVLRNEPALLRGSFVADKVTGKGAAALMVLGAVKGVYADTVSEAALRMFADGGISIDYSKCVQNIINRAGTGMCPIEELCLPCHTAAECLPLIEAFASRLTDLNKN